MININSVPEYLTYLEKINTINRSTYTVGCFTLYRGQANYKWDLNPSLYRSDLFKEESLLLTEAKSICPNEFLNSRFETLVKMQHFGMPTRLLDTTTNPLVALYFACASNNETESDGAVYIFPNLPVSWSTDPLIDLIMDFIFEHCPIQCCLEDILNVSKEKYKNVVHRLMPDSVDSLLHYLTIPAFAVMPDKTNERIQAQDGAFFVCGMALENIKISTNPGTLGKRYYNFSPVDLKSNETIWKDSQKIVIPNSAKGQILSQLDIIGINESKLFPDLEHKIQHVIRNVQLHRFR